MTADSAPRNIQAKGAMTRLFNRSVEGLTRHGISIWGSRVLAVRGRSSGQWRTTPVNPLTHDGKRYLVAPRGHTQWVRNMRVAGGGELRVGRRVERFTATELADEQKPDVLRAYLRRWKFEGGTFFGAGGPGASPEGGGRPGQGTTAGRGPAAPACGDRGGIPGQPPGGGQGPAQVEPAPVPELARGGPAIHGHRPAHVPADRMIDGHQ